VRRRLALPALLALLAARALVACSSPPAEVAAAPGDGGSDAPEADAQPLRAAGYCEATADFFCDYYLRCGRIVAATKEECRATFLETCNARYEQRYVDLEAAGLLSISAAGVDACRSHLATVACERQITDLMGPCGAMWVGTQPAGSACGLDVESFTCAPGTACVVGLDLCGTCESASAEGGPCGGGVTCAGDFACLNAKCVARRQVGEACSASEPCVVGAGCTGAVCVAPLVVGEGEACDATHRCRYRSACQGGLCVRAALLGEDCAARTCASGRCVTEGAAKLCRALLDPGAACTTASECRSASCVKGTCHPLPDACIP
jgi:hypothetical protein